MSFSTFVSSRTIARAEPSSTPKPPYEERLACLLTAKRAELKALKIAKPPASPPPQHHTKEEVVKAMKPRFNREEDKDTTSTQTPTPPSTTKTTTKISVSRPVTPPERPRNLPTPPATPTTPKRSRLPSPTPNVISKRVETASTTCPLPTSPATPPLLRKSPSKLYLTIHDLVRMFAEKPRPFDLSQHQKRRPSPQSPVARSYQSRITVYFLPAANQKAPISQGLKSSKPKSFQQHTPAKSIRPASALPEKSAFSPYKMAGISYTNRRSWQSRSSPRSSFAWPPPTSSPSFRSPPPDLHVCCTCFGHSSFSNDLFNYRRPSQQHPSNRRPIEEMR